MTDYVSQLTPFFTPFLGGFAFALFIMALVGRAPVRLFAPALRATGFVFRPFVQLLRILRLIPKSAGRARTARNAAVGATSTVGRGVGHASDIEEALRVDDDATTGAAYDFAEEESLLRRDGWVFRAIRIPGDYLPPMLTATLTDDVAEKYVAEAETFFSRQVSLYANEKSLYEDAEGAFAISLFRNNDRRCYYVLNEMRKTINGNARRLVLAFTAVLAAGIYFILSPATPALVDVAIAVGAVGAMLLMHIAGYQKQQQHNTRELRAFLTGYLGRISDRYREATGFARGVTVGDETDSKKLSEDARKWHNIMMWMPFRAFFIESFVRNVLYQINRNTEYYGFVPKAAVVAVLAAAAWLVLTNDTPAPNYLSADSALLAACIGALLLVYVKLIFKIVLREEFTQMDWLGYDNLNVSTAMGEVVGKYAEDVGFWKGRFER